MKVAVILWKHGKAKDGLCPINLRITKGTTVRYRPVVDLRIAPEHWDAKAAQVKRSHPHHLAINAKITELRRRAEDLVIRGEHTTPDALRDALSASTHTGADFYAIARRRIAERAAVMSPRTAKQRLTALALTERTAPGLTLAGLTPSVLERMQAELLAQGLSPNTINSRFRRLRTMWLDACRSEGVELRSPWRSIRLQDVDVEHTYLTVDEVLRLEALDLSRAKPLLRVVRDAWMLSMYTGGRRFSDLCTLGPEHVKDGWLVWAVHKSKRKRVQRVYLLPQALAIIGRYTGGPYLLPLLERRITDRAERIRAIDGAQNRVNRALKVLDAIAGIGKELSTHMTRHTFANWARGRVPIEVVQQILGHESVSQTEDYMDGFAAPQVQAAMEAFGQALERGRRSLSGHKRPLSGH